MTTQARVEGMRLPGSILRSASAPARPDLRGTPPFGTTGQSMPGTRFRRLPDSSFFLLPSHFPPSRVPIIRCKTKSKRHPHNDSHRRIPGNARSASLPDWKAPLDGLRCNDAFITKAGKVSLDCNQTNPTFVSKSNVSAQQSTRFPPGQGGRATERRRCHRGFCFHRRPPWRGVFPPIRNPVRIAIPPRWKTPGCSSSPMSFQCI